MNNLIFIHEKDGIEFYIYKPSFLNLYYPCYTGDEVPQFFSRFIHKVRMIREIIVSKYQVVYMMKDKAIIGHLVVGRGGSRIEMSTKRDIVIGPIFVVPRQRSHGYASIGIKLVLNDLKIDYDYAYEYIEKKINHLFERLKRMDLNLLMSAMNTVCLRLFDQVKMGS